MYQSPWMHLGDAHELGLGVGICLGLRVKDLGHELGVVGDSEVVGSAEQGPHFSCKRRAV